MISGMAFKDRERPQTSVADNVSNKRPTIPLRDLGRLK